MAAILGTHLKKPIAARLEDYQYALCRMHWNKEAGGKRILDGLVGQSPPFSASENSADFSRQILNSP